MGKYDSLGCCDEGRDLYYVNTPPNTPKKKSLSRWDIETFEQEQLERQFYVRLQGHKGKILPALGQFCKIIVLVFLLPYYGVIFLKRELEKLARIIYRKIVNILTPPALKVYRISLKVMSFFLMVKNRIEKVIQTIIQRKNNCVEKIKEKMLKCRDYVCNPIIAWRNKKQRQCIDWLNRCFAYIKGCFSAVLSKIAKSIHSRIDRFKAEIVHIREILQQEMLLTSQQKIQQFNERLIEKQQTLSQRFARKSRSCIAWGRVLTRYGMRVIEDWSLEIKRWFSLQ